VSNQRLPDLAFMATLADGSHTVMSLGSVVSTDATLHTALDSDVVFHEFTHGVVRRSVGRSLDLFPLQDTISQGLDEGWADYYALTIQNFSLEPERTRILDYATSERRGIRSGPYDDDYPVHAAEQADIPVDDPQGAYGLIGLPPYTNRHAIGEIWAATLMKMNRDLIIALGDKSRGHRIGWQIVFNGLQKCSANPTFIQARDKILTALDDLPSLTQEERRSARRAAWGAFAHFGIGVGAKPSNPGTLRTVGDKSLPLDL
jgi:extracellular elastinolytic metalloproteinase